MSMSMIIAILVMVMAMVRDIVVVTDIRIVRIGGVVIDLLSATIAMVMGSAQGKNP